MKKTWRLVSVPIPVKRLGIVCVFLLLTFSCFSVADKTNTLKLIRTLDDYLAEYEALCNQKQVSKDGQE